MAELFGTWLDEFRSRFLTTNNAIATATAARARVFVQVVFVRGCRVENATLAVDFQ
jgi:hypothetical protein